MPFGYKLFLLLSLLPWYGFAQSNAQWEEKALYKDYLYLNHLLYNSHNPVSISEAPGDVADFAVGYSSAWGNYKRIDRGQHETVWSGSIFGIRKFDKLSFQGEIVYGNEKRMDKRWSNYLFISEDNPFFMADSIPSDYGIEQFQLSGGFSYEITPRWRTALRAVYRVGTLVDQTDPRPSTQGMRFYLNPGIDYHLGESFTLGLSAGIGRLNESVGYTVVNSNEPNVSTLFLFKGLGNPELKNAIGYKRRYKGNQYRGDIQLVWNNRSSLSNLLEAGYLAASEEAHDGDTGFDYKGGDYRITAYTLTDRFQLQTRSTIHNLTARIEGKSIDGVWYIQTQSTDLDGNVVWEIKDKSIVHQESGLLASMHYRIDRLKANNPHLTGIITGTYTRSDVKQYPDLYSRMYSLMTWRGDLSKHLHLLKGLFSLSLNAAYTATPSHSLHVEGSKLNASYLEPAFQAISGSSYAFGAGITYQTPLLLSDYPFLLKTYADATLEQYSGQADFYQNTHRRFFNIGISLVF